MKRLFLLLFIYGILFSVSFPAQNFRWAKTMGGPGNDGAGAPAADSDGNVYMLGSFTDTVDLDPGPGVAKFYSAVYGGGSYILKLDSSGTFQWAKAITGQAYITFSNLVLDEYRNIYVFGHFSGVVDFDPGPGTFTVGTNGGGYSAFVLKLNPNGHFAWVKSIGNWGAYVVYSDLKIDGQGHLYLAGEFSTTGINAVVDFNPGPSVFNKTGDNDAFLAKWDTLGNFIWVKTWYSPPGSPSSTGGARISLTKNNDLYFAGTFVNSGLSKVDFDPGPPTVTLTGYGQEDVFISKFDGNGNLVWAKSIGGAGIQYLNGMEVDQGGNVSIAGTYWGICDFDPDAGFAYIAANHDRDVFVARYNPNGALIWANSFGALGPDECSSMALDSSGNIFVAGGFSTTVDFDPGPAVYTLSCNNFFDAFVLKLDSNGGFQWANSIKSSSPKSYGWGHICVSQHRDLYFAGQFHGTIDLNPDYAKMIVSGISGDGFILKLGPCDTKLIISGPWNICAGQCVTLTAQPAPNYAWCDSLGFGSSMVDCPLQTRNYSVTAGIADNCTATGTHTILVAICVNEREHEQESDLQVFPVPATDKIHIVSTITRKIKIINQLGVTILAQQIKEGETIIAISHFVKGIYYLVEDSLPATGIKKIIKN